MSRLADTQKDILPIILKCLTRGPADCNEMEVKVAALLPNSVYYWHKDFYERVQRLVKRGQIVKVKRGGRCLYALPDGFPADFDLSDDTARLVAADVAEESGRDDVATMLRTASKVERNQPKTKGTQQ